MGRALHVYNRSMLLIDADGFTRAWYRDHANVDLRKALQVPGAWEAAACLGCSSIRAAHGNTDNTLQQHENTQQPAFPQDSCSAPAPSLAPPPAC